MTDIEPCYYCGNEHPIMRTRHRDGLLRQKIEYDVYCDHPNPPIDGWKECYRSRYGGGAVVGPLFSRGTYRCDKWRKSRELAIKDYNELQIWGRELLKEFQEKKIEERL